MYLEKKRKEACTQIEVTYFFVLKYHFEEYPQEDPTL